MRCTGLKIAAFETKNLVSVTHPSFCHMVRDVGKRPLVTITRDWSHRTNCRSRPANLPCKQERARSSGTGSGPARPLVPEASVLPPSVPGCLPHPSPAHLVINGHSLFSSAEPSAPSRVPVQPPQRTTFLTSGATVSVHKS